MAEGIPYESVSQGIKGCRDALWSMNSTIYDNPELGYNEVVAHDTITACLEKQGFQVKKHAYDIATSFEAEFGEGGRLVIFCAEYDALPDIRHACGHNLIATSSVAAFLGLAQAIKESNIQGRIRILGTPAEEGGGGKVKLLEAGAFDDNPAAAIMMHPTSAHVLPPHITGVAGVKFVASLKLRVEFHGHSAHAGGAPWEGRNALDAAVAAYTSVSMLRQQIHPDERIHGVIEDGGKSPNVIPSHTKMNWYIRSPTVARGSELLSRVKACFEAAATATGCTLTYTEYVLLHPALKYMRTDIYQGTDLHGSPHQQHPQQRIRKTHVQAQRQLRPSHGRTLHLLHRHGQRLVHGTQFPRSIWNPRVEWGIAASAKLRECGWKGGFF